jgi:hypothetical protein
MVEFGGAFTKTTGLTAAHWGISIGIAAFTFPLGIVMRFIPVPAKPSDYAHYFQIDFAERMERRRTLKGPTGVAPRKSEDEARVPDRVDAPVGESMKSVPSSSANKPGTARTSLVATSSAASNTRPQIRSSVGPVGPDRSDDVSSPFSSTPGGEQQGPNSLSSPRLPGLLADDADAAGLLVATTSARAERSARSSLAAGVTSGRRTSSAMGDAALVSPSGGNRRTSVNSVSINVRPMSS